MTDPRIIPAAEAEELRRVSDAAIETMTAAGAGEAQTRAAVLVRDLAASVVELHALLDEAYDIIVSQRNPAWDGWCDRVCKIDLEATP